MKTIKARKAKNAQQSKKEIKALKAKYESKQMIKKQTIQSVLNRPSNNLLIEAHHKSLGTILYSI